MSILTSVEFEDCLDQLVAARARCVEAQAARACAQAAAWAEVREEDRYVTGMEYQVAEAVLPEYLAWQEAENEMTRWDYRCRWLLNHCAARASSDALREWVPEVLAAIGRGGEL